MIRSKKVLLCWELGGSSGHLVCLIRLAAALVDRGHHPVLALDPIHFQHPVVTAGPVVEKIEAPSFSTQSFDPSFHAHSLADVLGQFGFADSRLLKERVSRWRQLIKTVGPEVILCDFSPFVCLAAKGLVRTISVGSGFATPPAESESFPALNESVAPTYDYDNLTSTANKVARECDIEIDHSSGSLVSLTSANEALIRCYPLFDPYQTIGRRDTRGPNDVVTRISRSRSDQWPNQFYAYLSGSHPGTPGLIEALSSSEFGGQVFISSPSQALVNAFDELHLQLLPTMPELSQVLPKVSLVIHHASLGMAGAGAAAGIPQLVIPRHLEQELTGERILRNKIGACLIPPYTREDVVRGVERLMTVNAYREHAQRVADEIAQTGPYRFIDKVIERVEEL